MGDRSIESLIDLPRVENPEYRAAMKLLTNLYTPCYLSGDKPFADAAYALFNDSYCTMLAEAHLDALRQVCEANAGFHQPVQMRGFADAPQVIGQWGLALWGLATAPTSLTSANFNQEAYCRTRAGHSLFEMFYQIAKPALLYTFDDTGPRARWQRRQSVSSRITLGRSGINSAFSIMRWP